MEVIIEIPKSDDFESVNKLAKKVHKLHVNWNPDLFLDVDEVISREDFENMLENKNMIVAKIQDKIVGYMTFSMKEKINPVIRYRKYLAINAICVDEKNRENGIGTKLLNYAKEIGKENDCTDLFLTVNEENKNAIKLYEKFGFKVKSIEYLMKI